MLWATVAATTIELAIKTVANFFNISVLRAF